MGTSIFFAAALVGFAASKGPQWLAQITTSCTCTKCQTPVFQDDFASQSVTNGKWSRSTAAWSSENGGVMVINPAADNQNASCNPITNPIAASRNWRVEFDFRISDPDWNGYADGLSFWFQRGATGTRYYAVELDTYYNTSNGFTDYPAPHIALNYGTSSGESYVGNHVVQMSASGITDGAFHHLRIDYDGGQVKVYLDGTLKINTTIPNADAQQIMWYGYTGASHQKNTIDNVQIWDFDCPVCGDGTREDPEQCDNGASNGQACTPAYNSSCTYCSSSCTNVTLQGPRCGDGTRNGTEQCDSGAQNGVACTAAYGSSCTYCSSSCTNVTLQGPRCGDGTRNGSEQCDNGASNGQACTPAYNSSCTYCSSSCTNVTLQGGTCGDGTKQGTEQCDGAANPCPSGQTCTGSCQCIQVTVQCNDGIDNDGDGAIDGNDFGCDSILDNDEANPQAACQDGSDNDGDGLIDFPNDPGCASAQDNDEYNAPSSPTCYIVNGQTSPTVEGWYILNNGKYYNGRASRMVSNPAGTYWQIYSGNVGGALLYSNATTDPTQGTWVPSIYASGTISSVILCPDLSSSSVASQDADLSIGMTADAAVPAQSPWSSTVTITNNGPGTVSSFSFKVYPHPFELGLPLLSAPPAGCVPFAGWPGEYDCTVSGSFSPGQTRSFTFTYLSPNTTGQYLHVLRGNIMSASAPDRAPANNSATLSLTVTAAASSSSSPAAVCGNGVVETGEICETSGPPYPGCNQGDTCWQCTACVRCGNGVADPGEVCARPPVCDSPPGYSCTFGPTSCPQDLACSSSSFSSSISSVSPGICGNSQVEAGEQCDMPGGSCTGSAPYCSTTCQCSAPWWPTCGDGTCQSTERLSAVRLAYPGVIGYAYFGAAVAPLGDIDGDQVPDIAISASGDWSPNAGTIYVQHLTAAGGVKFTDTLTTYPRTPPQISIINFGGDIENVGDLDGNGIPDIAVGAWGAETTGTPNNFDGEVWIFLLQKDGSGHISVKSQSVISSPADFIYFGYTLAYLGNGRLAVGSKSGVWLTTLSAGGGGTPTLIAGTSLGTRILPIGASGDLDGDGVQDLLIGRLGGLRILYLTAAGGVKSSQDLPLADADMLSPNGFNRGYTFAQAYASGDSTLLMTPVSIAPLADTAAGGAMKYLVGVQTQRGHYVDISMSWIVTLTGNGTNHSVASFDKIYSFDHYFPWQEFGRNAARVGDVDGDSVDDYVIGEPRQTVCNDGTRPPPGQTGCTGWLYRGGAWLVLSGGGTASCTNDCGGAPPSSSSASSQSSVPTAATCGNGLKETGEGCDDGNTTSGDGCSAACAVEPGGQCWDVPAYRFNGQTVEFSSHKTWSVKTVALDDQHALVAYQHISQNFMGVNVATIQSGQITFGPSATINGSLDVGGNNVIDIQKLDSARAVIAYMTYTDPPNSPKCRAVVAQVSGDTVTFGTPVDLIPMTADYTCTVPSVAVLSPSKVVFGRSAANLQGGTPSGLGYHTFIGTIAGTQITLSTPVAVSTTPKYYLLRALDATHIMAFGYTSNPDTLTARVGEVTGGTVSWGTEVQLPAIWPASNAYVNNIVPLSPTRVLLVAHTGGLGGVTPIEVQLSGKEIVSMHRYAVVAPAGGAMTTAGEAHALGAQAFAVVRGACPNDQCQGEFQALAAPAAGIKKTPQTLFQQDNVFVGDVSLNGLSLADMGQNGMLIAYTYRPRSGPDITKEFGKATLGVRAGVVSACVPASTCGNGTVEGFEECDTGHACAAGYSCSATCLCEQSTGSSASSAQWQWCTQGFICSKALINDQCELGPIPPCQQPGELAGSCGTAACQGVCWRCWGGSSSSAGPASSSAASSASSTSLPSVTCPNGILDAGETCEIGVCCPGGQTCDRTCHCVNGGSSSSGGSCSTSPWALCPTGFSCLADCGANGCLQLDHMDCPSGQQAEYSGTCGNGTCSGQCGRCVTASSSSIPIQISSSSVSSAASIACGNRRLEGSEQCEVGIPCVNGRVCTNCVCSAIGFCGDDIVDPLRSEQCEQNADCPAGSVCSLQCQCEVTHGECGNGELEGSEQCESGHSCPQAGQICNNCLCSAPPRCGNRELEYLEECEIGNPCPGGQTCVNCICRAPGVCGNGVLETNEQCENDSHCRSGETCDRSTCRCQGEAHNYCGDTVLNEGEECEMNAPCTEEGKNCDLNTCLCVKQPVILSCGDATLDPGEDCDIGISCPAGEYCSFPSCHCTGSVPRCGNGKLEGAERCEIGVGCTLPGEVCDITTCQCAPPDPSGTCGNGLITIGEECEVGIPCPFGWSCDFPHCACLNQPVCGNGVLDPGELCEINSPCAGDQQVCDFSRCRCTGRIYKCGNGVRDPGEECDDGNTLSDDGCSKSCLRETLYSFVGGSSLCGNGIVEGTEECDDGNFFSGDGCSAFCFREENVFSTIVTAPQGSSASSLGSVPGHFAPAGVVSSAAGPASSGAHGPQQFQSSFSSARAGTSPLAAVTISFPQPFGVNPIPPSTQGQMVPSGFPYGIAQAPIASTGPESVALVSAGAALGWAWIRRRRRV